jgi:hypothetical protein
MNFAHPLQPLRLKALTAKVAKKGRQGREENPQILQGPSSSGAKARIHGGIDRHG